MKIPKKSADLLLLALTLVLGFYFLYQKGYIFAGFDSLSPQEAYAMMREDGSETLLLDVRTQSEYATEGHIAGAKLIELRQLEAQIGTLSPYKRKKIIVYCRSGNRSVSASRLLADHGYRVYNLSGGIKAWKKERLPLQ
jgi:rhodanese-related sulfurtransferase